MGGAVNMVMKDRCINSKLEFCMSFPTHTHKHRERERIRIVLTINYSTLRQIFLRVQTHATCFCQLLQTCVLRPLRCVFISWFKVNKEVPAPLLLKNTFELLLFRRVS